MKSYALRFTPDGSRLRQHQPFLLVLVVFLTFRLLLPFVFRNGSYFVEQAPDIGDFMRWGMLADSRLYPYVNYSWGYPPLFPWSVIGLYRISTLLPAWLDQRLWFSIVMQLAMAAADTGSLILIYLIARRMGSKARAVRAAALFAASFIMAYAASGWYEAVPVFLMLLALYLALRDRFAWSMLFVGLGFVTKIAPIVIAPAVVKRMRNLRQQVLYVVELSAVIVALLAPFLVTGADHLLAFVRVTLNRPTWLSIWALFDGNYQYGATLPISDRFSPDNVGAPAVSVLPWPIILLAFLAIFLFVFMRRLDWRAPRNTIAFAGVSVNLLLLWSKGFSGQFIAYTVPFVVLLMPNLRGAIYAALLSVVWVAEWPLAFQMMDGQNWFIAWLIIVRTIVLIALTLEFSAQLFSRITPGALRITRYSLLICWLTVPFVGLAALNGYTQSRLAADPATPAINFVREQPHDGTPIVFAGVKLYRRLYPEARPLGEVLLLPGAKYVPEDMRVPWLNDLTVRGPFWFVSETNNPDTANDDQQAETWMTEHACRVDSHNAGSARVSRFIGPLNATGSFRTSGAVFNEEIELNGFQLSQSALKPGDGLCVELKWQALKQPSADDTVFVHVINAAGQLVAQNDMPPQSGFAPTSQWQPGAEITDRHGVILPGNLPPGEYTVRVGLYRSDNQAPVPVTYGDAVPPNAIVLAQITVAP